jgi:hypothetical protein
MGDNYHVKNPVNYSSPWSWHTKDDPNCKGCVNCTKECDSCDEPFDEFHHKGGICNRPQWYPGGYPKKCSCGGLIHVDLEFAPNQNLDWMDVADAIHGNTDHIDQIFFELCDKCGKTTECLANQNKYRV